MSEVVDIPKARLEIGKNLGLTPTENEVRSRQIAIALQGKKFVLLLDNLQDFSDFDMGKIGIPRNEQQRAKVVFTTRHTQVCYRMSRKSVIQLDCLSTEDTFELFGNMVGESTLGSHQSLPTLAKTLANLCGGLPVVIVRTAVLMVGKTAPAEWNLIIQRLQRLKLEEDVQKVFEECYDSLPETPNNPSKSCFQFACLFPTSCLPTEKQLVHYLIGDNILKEFDKLQDNIVHGLSMIESLKRGFFLDHENDSTVVRMHNMFRAAALAIGNGRLFVRTGGTLVDFPKDINWAEVERISLVHITIPEFPNFAFEKLSTLILKKAVVKAFMYDFFDNMPSLRVLDMSECDIDRFPRSITKLVTLQYLNMSYTNLTELPDELKNLTELKFLDLSYLAHLQLFPQGVFASLSKLQFLDLYNSSEGAVLSGDGVSLLLELENLENLENLGLTVQSGQALQKLGKSKKLQCCTSLLIKTCEDLTSIEIPLLTTLENLEVLGLHDCINLLEFNIGSVTAVNNGPFGVCSCFMHLRDVEIEGCWVLKGLSWLIFAPQIQSLTVKNCMEVGAVTKSEGIRAIEGIDHGAICKNLRALHLICLPDLKYYSDLDLTLPMLEQITLQNCPKVENLPIKSQNKEKLKWIKTDRELWEKLTRGDEAINTDFGSFCQFI